MSQPLSGADAIEWQTYTASSIDEQANVFLKAFVLEFNGNEWEQVLDAASQFKRFVPRTADARQNDLEENVAHQFLEKRGETVTSLALRQNVNAMDIDHNHRLCFLEYCLYKWERSPDQFFAALRNPKRGGGEALKQAIAAYRAVLEKREAREQKMAELEALAAQGGVKGTAAKHELEQMRAADQLEQNKAEITSAANKRKAEKNAVDPFEEERARVEAEARAKAEEEERKRQDSRSRLAARAQMFNHAE